jgi:hypothetical protein
MAIKTPAIARQAWEKTVSIGVILMTGITGIRAMERWKGDAPVFLNL